VLPSLNCLFEQLFPSQFASIYIPGRYMGDQDESDETTSIGSSGMKLNGSESYSGQVMGKIGEKRRLKGPFGRPASPAPSAAPAPNARNPPYWMGMHRLIASSGAPSIVLRGPTLSGRYARPPGAFFAITNRVENSLIRQAEISLTSSPVLFTPSVSYPCWLDVPAVSRRSCKEPDRLYCVLLTHQCRRKLAPFQPQTG
jgi:hypothetical protein